MSALARRGAAIRAVIRTGTADRLPFLPRLEIVETEDLFARDRKWWATQCGGIEYFAHLAWIATPGVYLTAPENIDCLSGTLAMAQGAADAGIDKFVGIGTCFEYDVDARVLDIDTPLRPNTPYAGAKAAAFQSLSQWLPQQGVRFAWARLFYLYGEGEHPRRLVPYLHERLAAGERADLTSGEQIRDFLDVKAGAKMLIDALFDNTEGAFNICSGRPTTVRQLAEAIAAKYGRPELLNFGARPDNLIDPPCVVGVPHQQLATKSA